MLVFVKNTIMTIEHGYTCAVQRYIDGQRLIAAGMQEKPIRSGLEAAGVDLWSYEKIGQGVQETCSNSPC